MFLLSFLFACFPDLSKNDPERFLEYPAGDYDGDGYSENQGDCDDLNPNVRPYAEEHCDGLDNDCNGLVDDGAVDR